MDLMLTVGIPRGARGGPLNVPEEIFLKLSSFCTDSVGKEISHLWILMTASVWASSTVEKSLWPQSGIMEFSVIVGTFVFSLSRTLSKYSQ